MEKMSCVEEIGDQITKLLTNLNEKRNEDNRIIEIFKSGFDELGQQLVSALRNELNNNYISDEIINERLKVVETNCKDVTAINHKIKFIESKFKQHSNLFDNN